MINESRRFRITPLGIITFFVVLMVISPLLIIVPTSFTSTGVLRFPPEGFSLQWYVKIFDRPEFIESFWVSVKLASISAVIATIIGTLAAFALHKYKPPGCGTINALLLSPLTVPSLIIGISALLFFTRIGLAGTFTGLLLSHILISVPVCCAACADRLKLLRLYVGAGCSDSWGKSGTNILGYYASCHPTCYFFRNGICVLNIVR